MRHTLKKLTLNDPLNQLNEGNSLNKVKEGGCTKQIQARGMPLKNQWKDKIVNEHLEGVFKNKTHRTSMPQTNSTDGEAQSQHKRLC